MAACGLWCSYHYCQLPWERNILLSSKINLLHDLKLLPPILRMLFSLQFCYWITSFSVMGALEYSLQTGQRTSFWNLDIKRKNASPYHPQTDRMVERFNANLVRRLSIYVASHQRDWDLHLNAVLFVYRTSLNESRGESPYVLLFGPEPTLPPDTTL